VETAERLANLRTWLEDDLQRLETQIAAKHGSEENLATRASSHLLHTTGKRIRPLCVILSARLGGREADEEVIDLAVAAELVHAATLLHDDVLDEGETRRGVDTARIAFGNSASILGGDHLLVSALQRVERGGTPVILSDLLKTISAMVHAEALQLGRRGRFNPSIEVYDAVVKGKTARLFEWSMRAGAIRGGFTPEQADKLAAFGHNLGMAFQLVDDTLDLSSDTATTGKDSLRDLKEGKMTWPLILACQSDPLLENLLNLSMRNPDYMDDPDRVANLREGIVATGCIEATRARARDFAERAHAILDRFPDTSARNALFTLLDGAVARVS
jgi:octaprenyl-diphosphate synthase